MFASFKQIDQAADMFLDTWAIKKMLYSKSIQCSYSVTHEKKDGKHPDPYKRWKLETNFEVRLQLSIHHLVQFCGLLKE
jgi:hypothetical protein